MKKPEPFLLIIILIILIMLFSCQDLTPNSPEIRGTWYGETINTPMGAGFAETKIQLFNTTYIFSSNSIMGIIVQNGLYEYDGDVIRIEMSFPSDPFTLLGKSGSVWKVTLDGEFMFWENTRNDYTINWKKAL